MSHLWNALCVAYGVFEFESVAKGENVFRDLVLTSHVSIVFTVLTVSHWIERQTGWSIKKFVRTTCCYRTVQIRAGKQALTAADPLPHDLNEALTEIASHIEH
jgi:hypothetical protein